MLEKFKFIAGDSGQLAEPFKVDNKLVAKRQTLFVHISETTLEERRQRQKLTSALSLQSIECCHIFTAESVAAEFKTRKHYAGNNASNIIGPVSLITEDSAWTRTVKDKRLIYGKDNRVAPGGRTQGVETKEQAKALTRKPEDLEPVFYFSFPWQFHEDVFAGCGARTITALTMGDGSMALAAMLMGKPFVGVALTEEHADGVRTWLATTIFKGFFTEGSPFYDARIAAELTEAGLSKAQQAAEADVELTPEAKVTKAKAKAKAKAAVPKAAAKKRAGSELDGGGKKPKTSNADSVSAKMKAALAALNGKGEGGDTIGDEEIGDGEDDEDDDEQ